MLWADSTLQRQNWAAPMTSFDVSQTIVKFTTPIVLAHRLMPAHARRLVDFQLLVGAPCLAHIE
jgi:hypothetical protein